MKRQEKVSKERHSSVLGPLEHEIMDVLWSRGRTSGKDIFADIKGRRRIALTTVLTVLKRLVAKGFVKKVKGKSVYLYGPTYTKDDFAREVSAPVLKDIFSISTSGATATFVDMLAKADPGELDRLGELIESKKKEMRTDGR
jgi:predicted transcriptional regulator